MVAWLKQSPFLWELTEVDLRIFNTKLVPNFRNSITNGGTIEAIIVFPKIDRDRVTPMDLFIQNFNSPGRFFNNPAKILSEKQESNIVDQSGTVLLTRRQSFVIARSRVYRVQSTWWHVSAQLAQKKKKCVIYVNKHRNSRKFHEFRTWFELP